MFSWLGWLIPRGLIAVGVALIVLSFTADLIGVGGGPGFGGKHWVALFAGVVLGALGFWLVPRARQERLVARARQAIENDPPARPGEFATLAVWLGVAAGIAELLVIVVQLKVGQRYMAPNVHVGWMAPLSYALLLLIPAVLLELNARRASGSGRGLQLGAFLLAFWAWFGPFHMLSPEVHIAAAMLLAVALGARTAVVIGRRRDRVFRFTRRALPTLGLVILVLGTPWPVRLVLGESSARRGLAEAAADSPNVLLIILDTVRAANLSLHGYPRETTPHLSAFASEGVMFEQAISTAPWTLPSHASMFTGRYPYDLSTDWRATLDETHPTLAEQFRSRGYLTGAFVANLEYGGRHTGLPRGFVHYDSDGVSAGEVLRSSSLGRFAFGFSQWRHGWRPWLPRLWDFHNQLGRKSAKNISSEFFDWVAGRGDRPIFAFLNYYDAHSPYLPPAAYQDLFKDVSPPPAPMDTTWMSGETVTEWIDAYDESLAYLDYELGRFFGELRERGLLDNTLVIVTSDHGEEFAERGLMEHGESLYLPSIHVPLIIRFPGSVPESRRVASTVTLRDIPATIVDLVGLESEAVFSGRTLARFWQGPDQVPADDPEPFVVAQTSGKSWVADHKPISKGNMTSVLVDGLHLIRNGDGTEELYDIRADPWEQHNLVDEPALAAALERLRVLAAPLVESYPDSDPR
jgi:arylsulfatase A-like enzyme